MFNISKLASLAQNVTVLYVEDDKNVSEHTSEFLKKFFKLVDVAYDGAHGLELYKEHKHDLVLTDVKMPIINGFEMARLIKEIKPEQKILAISAYDFSEFAEPGMHKRFDKFLAKPVSYQDFIAVLEELCEEVLGVDQQDSILSNTKQGSELQILQMQEKIWDLEKRIKKLEEALNKRD